MSSRRSPKIKMPAYDAAKHRAFKDKARGIDCDSESDLKGKQPKILAGLDINKCRTNIWRHGNVHEWNCFSVLNDPAPFDDSDFMISSKDEPKMSTGAAARRRAFKDKAREIDSDSENEEKKDSIKPKYMNMPERSWLSRD